MEEQLLNENNNHIDYSDSYVSLNYPRIGPDPPYKSRGRGSLPPPVDPSTRNSILKRKLLSAKSVPVLNGDDANVILMKTMTRYLIKWLISICVQNSCVGTLIRDNRWILTTGVCHQKSSTLKKEQQQQQQQLDQIGGRTLLRWVTGIVYVFPF